MSKHFLKLSIIAATLTLPSVLMAADDVSVTAGETSTITTFTNISDSCEDFGKPKTTIMTAPRHGKISFSRSTTVMDDGPCKGKTVKATLVLYKSEGGYKGDDYFKVGFTTPQYDDGTGSTFDSFDFNVTVE